MKTAIVLTLAAIVVSAAHVACSAPAPASNGKNTADATAKKKSGTTAKGDDDDDSTKAPAKKTTTAAAPHGAATTAPTAAPTGGAPADQGVACLTQCVSTDPEAKQLFDASQECGMKCGETDEACLGKCSEQDRAACASGSPACTKVDQCVEQCLPTQDVASDTPHGQ
jgi:hypothetical protein